jgi:ribonuclease T2
VATDLLRPSSRRVKIATMKKANPNPLRRWMLLLAAGLACSSASARHHHRAQNESDAVAGQFDYYLLSLSWSPSYCLTHQDDRAQCGGKGYGFVVHGLWPQYSSGGYPQNCSTPYMLTDEARRVGNSIYPSPNLVEHEWRRHGTCSGVDAITYFRSADRAAAAVQVPASLQTPRTEQSLTAAQILAAFHDANTRIPANGMIAACSRGELSEVRVCLDRNLALSSCGRGVRTSCPATAVSVPASR